MANATENVGGTLTNSTAPGMRFTAEARKKLDDLTVELQKTGANVVTAAGKCRSFFCGE